MAITEAELRRLTAELDEVHHATLPILRHRAETHAEDLRHRMGRHGPGPSRRGFLRGAGAAAVAALAFGACAADPAPPADVAGDQPPETTSPGRLAADLQFACMATALENLAVGTYQAGIDAATADRLGGVPPAVMTFLETVLQQHQDHADAFNSLLTGAGRPRVTVPDPVAKTEVDKGFSQVRDIPALARLVLSLENVAGATYLSGVGVIENEKALQTAMSIQPVEMQHAAILNLLLGQYPVPDTFARLDGARPASDCPVR